MYEFDFSLCGVMMVFACFVVLNPLTPHFLWKNCHASLCLVKQEVHFVLLGSNLNLSPSLLLLLRRYGL